MSFESAARFCAASSPREVTFPRLGPASVGAKRKLPTGNAVEGAVSTRSVGASADRPTLPPLGQERAAELDGDVELFCRVCEPTKASLEVPATVRNVTGVSTAD